MNDRACSECGVTLRGRSPKALVCSYTCGSARTARIAREQRNHVPPVRACTECGGPVLTAGKHHNAITCGTRCSKLRTRRVNHERAARKPAPAAPPAPEQLAATRPCSECGAAIDTAWPRGRALTCTGPCAARRVRRLLAIHQARRAPRPPKMQPAPKPPKPADPLRDALHVLATALLAGDDHGIACAHADVGILLAREAMVEDPIEAMRWIAGLLP